MPNVTLVFDTDGISQMMKARGTELVASYEFYVRQFRTGYMLQTAKHNVPLTTLLSLNGATCAAYNLVNGDDLRADWQPR